MSYILSILIVVAWVHCCLLQMLIACHIYLSDDLYSSLFSNPAHHMLRDTHASQILRTINVRLIAAFQKGNKRLQTGPPSSPFQRHSTLYTINEKKNNDKIQRKFKRIPINHMMIVKIDIYFVSITCNVFILCHVKIALYPIERTWVVLMSKELFPIYHLKIICHTTQKTLTIPLKQIFLPFGLVIPFEVI